MLKRPAAIAVAIGLALFGVACGDDDEADTTATTAADEAGGETVAVTAVDYAFEGLPSTVAAGSRITLTNESTAELHEIVGFRVPDGVTQSAEELFNMSDEELAALLGGEPEPSFVLIASPGEESFPAVGDGTVTEPGRYVVGCFIPIGADPAEYLAAAAESQGGPPQVEGGPPHFTEGMHGEFTVS